MTLTAAVYVEEEKNRMRMRGISIEWESVSEKYVCDYIRRRRSTMTLFIPLRKNTVLSMLKKNYT